MFLLRILFHTQFEEISRGFFMLCKLHDHVTTVNLCFKTLKPTSDAIFDLFFILTPFILLTVLAKPFKNIKMSEQINSDVAKVASRTRERPRVYRRRRRDADPFSTIS